jgi:hypothetical protein
VLNDLAKTRTAGVAMLEPSARTKAGKKESETAKKKELQRFRQKSFKVQGSMFDVAP